MQRDRCMRYCVSSMKAGTECLSMRSKQECLSPSLEASSHTTVGRSCLWSPTSTSWRHPRVRGTRHAGSVDCAVSSIRTCSKAVLERESAPEPMHVQSTTSAP